MSDPAPAPEPSRIAAPVATRTTSSTSMRSIQALASEFAYPHAHLGYLTDVQAEALRNFKDVLEERKLWTRGPPASHDDPTLLRFLRARRFVVEDAYKQFKETEEWRAAQDTDVLYRTIELDAFEHSRRLYPQWTGRRDRRGIPLYVFQVKALDSKTVSAYEKSGANTTFSQAKTDGKTPPGLLRLFALYESLCNFVTPFASQLQDREFPDVPITMSTNIVDISGVGLKQFWNLKNHMQAASQLATAHYPETLDRIFVIGAPMFFNTVWAWIKRWFDPITVSKIFVLGPNEVKPTLEAFIDPRNIPKKYGGELDFEFGQLTVPDPAWEGIVHWEGGHTSFPSGPMVFSELDDGETLLLTGLGSKDGKLREERICTMPKQFAMPDPMLNTVQKVPSQVPARPSTGRSGTARSRPSTGDKKATPNGTAPVETTEKTSVEAPAVAPAPAAAAQTTAV